MRLWIATMIALAACSDDSPEARYQALESANQVHCGGYSITTTSAGCLDELHAQPALDCMNNALAGGVRASYFVGSLGENFFAEDTVMFTVDHEVRVFVDYPQGDANSNTAYAIEQPTCTGPFQLATVSHACELTDGYLLFAAGCSN